MRIAILSDIHGNSIALDAVLNDIEGSGGADEYWLLGDLAALGPDPVGVLERLSALPYTRYVRGNTDRYVTTRDRPPPLPNDAQADPSLVPAVVEIAATFSWTQGAITSAGWLDWLSRLPLDFRYTLPDGTATLVVHASPGRDDGPGFQPGMGDGEIMARLDGCDAGLVLVGHTHQFVDITATGTRVVNPGSISNPLPPDLRAFYAIMEGDTDGYTIESRRVDYDREAVVQAMERVRHPGAAFVAKHMRGGE